MITVAFKAVGPGACAWCRTEKDEVYTVAFSDQSFVGPMCKGDLLRAIGMKLGSTPAPVPAAVSVGNGETK